VETREGEQHLSSFRAINPNGKTSALVFGVAGFEGEKPKSWMPDQVRHDSLWLSWGTFSPEFILARPRERSVHAIGIHGCHRDTARGVSADFAPANEYDN